MPLWLAALDGAEPGTYLLVTHPGRVAPDMDAFYLEGERPGDVARERDRERRALTDPRLAAGLAARGVTAARLTDAA